MEVHLAESPVPKCVNGAIGQTCQIGGWSYDSNSRRIDNGKVVSPESCTGWKSPVFICDFMGESVELLPEHSIGVQHEAVDRLCEIVVLYESYKIQHGVVETWDPRECSRGQQSLFGSKGDFAHLLGFII